MSNTNDRLNKYRNELINKTVYWLTCIDVMYEDSVYTAKCQCKCGNIKLVPASRFAKQRCSKSCGCYKTSEEFSEKQRKYILDRPEIIEDSIKKTKEWHDNNPNKVKERNRKVSDWAKNNPDKIKEKEEKHRKWFKDNRDIFEEQCERQRQYYRDNPNKRKEISDRQKKYYSEHPEKRNEISVRLTKYFKNSNARINISNKRRQFFIDHQEAAAENGKKHSAWAKSNPDKVKERSEKHSQWCKNNPDKVKQQRESALLLYKNKRIAADYTDLLKIIHPDHIDDLMNGNIKANSIIKTRCPICNEYAEHTFNNVFLLKIGKLKVGRPRLCSKCNFEFSSSKCEDEIREYISTFYKEIPIQNSRDIISPLEIDLYYPEKKIAIEFNGDYWHSDEFKPNDYHYNKFKLCCSMGITLISIFENKWNCDREAIKMYLLDVFNDKTNELSFRNTGYMDNNYPAKCNLSNIVCSDYYMFKNHRVYTCGYTKIEN